MNRQDFMQFFRSDEFHQIMSEDDCVEIFLSVLKGQSDITIDLIKELLSDYSIDNIEVKEK